MNDTQSLEVLIQTTGEESLKVLRNLVTAMTQLNTTLSKTGQATTSIEKIGRASEQAHGKINKLTSAFGKLFTFMGAKRIGLKIMDFLDSSVNRAEELNLFNVIFKNVEKNGVKTFSDLGKEATRFQYKLNEVFGTNMTETLRYQGLFQAMATNSGVDEKNAALMSENMLKLTYDLASLYNRSEKSTAEALRAGVYAGQTKPLRNFGIDVTQTSINPVLQSLGITDRTFTDLTQAEKQIARYISTMRQASSAMGDFAETIESPANQLKVFKQQLVEVKTAWGNLFMGMYAEILPYANAILMVLKEIAKAIANIFGISTKDYNTGIGSLEDTYDAFEDVGKGASNATKATKELKRQVLGFDQINNLTTPKKSGSSGGSGGGGVGGGIDKRLLNALSGYDNLMDKVKMKATEIRDRWLQILGFKKKINPLTGEIYFEYQGLGTTIKNLANWFGDLSAKAKLFVGLGLVAIFSKLYTSVSKLLGVMGKGGLVTSTKDFVSALSMAFGGQSNAGILGNLGASIEMWRQQKGIIGENVGTLQGLWNGTKEFAKGLTVAAGGFTLMNVGLEDMADKGLTALNVIETLGGGIGTILGAAQAGAVFGPWGAAIGGFIGTVGTLVTAITGIGDAFDEDKQRYNKLKEAIEDDSKKLQDTFERLNDAYNESDSTFDYYDRLADELDNIVDKNGKIKQGYEERASVIVGELNGALGTEYKIVDGVIQKYGDLKTKVKELIDQKRAMAKLTALEEEYTTALKNQGQAEKNRLEAYKELVRYQNEIKEHLKAHAKYLGLTNEELYDFIINGKESANVTNLINSGNKQLVNYLANVKSDYQDEIKLMKEKNDKYEEASKNLDNYNGIIASWQKMYGLALKGNYEQINLYFDHERNLYGKDLKEKEEYWKQIVSDNKLNLELLEINRDKYSKEQYEAYKKQYNDQINLAKDSLSTLELITKTSNGNITDETVKQWGKMAKESSDNFLTNFNQLPQDVKDTLLEKMKGQRGIYSLHPK